MIISQYYLNRSKSIKKKIKIGTRRRARELSRIPYYLDSYAIPFLKRVDNDSRIREIGNYVISEIIPELPQIPESHVARSVHRIIEVLRGLEEPVPEEVIQRFDLLWERERNPSSVCIVVESAEDKLFLEQVISKVKGTSLEDLRYSVDIAPKNDQRILVKSQFVRENCDIKVIRDHDEDKEEDVLKEFERTLSNPKRNGKSFVNQKTKSIVSVVLMGLPDDVDLASIGINKYMMEDYLVKLIALDKNVQRLIGYNIKEIKKRTIALRNIGSLRNSKAVLATASVLADLGDEEHAMMRIIKTASKDNVEAVTNNFLEKILS
jgi:hypothetical protein